MKLIDIKKIDEVNHKRVTFIRIEPNDLQQTLSDIILSLSDISWINKFDEEFIRESFLSRVTPTIDDIKVKLLASSSDKVSSDAGEYVVSELSRVAIKEHLNYYCIPLAELFSKQRASNPGFDFYAENDCETLIFGEAKYLSDKNAYGVGLGQIISFIEDKKDIKDIVDLQLFFANSVLNNVKDGTKGFAVGFASKKISSDTLVSNILVNKDYIKLLNYHEIILIAVNI